MTLGDTKPAKTHVVVSARFLCITPRTLHPADAIHAKTSPAHYLLLCVSSIITHAHFGVANPRPFCAHTVSLRKRTGGATVMSRQLWSRSPGHRRNLKTRPDLSRVECLGPVFCWLADCWNVSRASCRRPASCCVAVRPDPVSRPRALGSSLAPRRRHRRTWVELQRQGRGRALPCPLFAFGGDGAPGNGTARDAGRHHNATKKFAWPKQPLAGWIWATIRPVPQLQPVGQCSAR